MGSKNPRAGAGAGAGVSLGSDATNLTRNRPILQAPPAARARLAMLRWSWPWMEARHG
jgi:hypothetical protein